MQQFVQLSSRQILCDVEVTYPEKTSNEASSKHGIHRAIWNTGIDCYSWPVQYVSHCSEVDDTQDSCLYEVVKEVYSIPLYGFVLSTY